MPIVHWTSALAIVLGTAIYRAIVHPGLARYSAWKASDRVPVARRNWRGVYVPDLTLIRLRRSYRALIVVTFVVGLFYLLFMIPHVQGAAR